MRGSCSMYSEFHSGRYQQLTSSLMTLSKALSSIDTGTYLDETLSLDASYLSWLFEGKQRPHIVT
jgi:hypothetical protein